MSDYEIPVPPAYRIHLTRVKAADMFLRTVVLGVATAVVIMLHWYLALVIIVPLVLLLVAAYIAWLSTLGATWVYTIDDRGAHLIGAPLKPLWAWVDVSWSSLLPIEVAEVQWRGLPALSITTSQFGCCLMVYGTESADKIRAEILPKIREWTRQR